MKKCVIQLILLILIFLFTSCNNIDMGKNENGTINLLEVIVPLDFGQPINLLEQGVKYSVHSTNTIEIVFDKELKDNDYMLGYFHNYNFMTIRNKYDEDKFVYFKYKIDKNKIIIEQNLGFFPNNPMCIYIPNTITACDNSRISNSEILVYSNCKILDEDYYTYINELIDREAKSIAQIKTKDDEKNIYLVTKDCKLCKDMNMEIELFDLFRGETVLVNNIDDNKAFVEVYFSLETNNDMFNEYVNVEVREKYNVVKGYIDTQFMTKIPEPLNDTNYYIAAITNNSEGGQPVVEFIISNQLSESERILIGEEIEQIDLDDIHFVETFLLHLLSDRFGKSYQITYGGSRENLGKGLVSKYDIDAHLPEYEWTEYEYLSYNDAYSLYSEYMLGMLKNYKVCDKYSNFKDYIINLSEKNIVLESIWMDWGYKAKLNKSYFFDEILERIDYSDDEKKEMTVVFEEPDETIETYDDTNNRYISNESCKSNQIFQYKLDFYLDNYHNKKEKVSYMYDIYDEIMYKYAVGGEE